MEEQSFNAVRHIFVGMLLCLIIIFMIQHFAPRPYMPVYMSPPPSPKKDDPE